MPGTVSVTKVSPVFYTGTVAPTWLAWRGMAFDLRVIFASYFWRVDRAIDTAWGVSSVSLYEDEILRISLNISMPHLGKQG